MAKKVFYQTIMLPLGAVLLAIGFQNCAKMNFANVALFSTEATKNNYLVASPMLAEPASDKSEKGTFVYSTCGWYKDSVNFKDCTPGACSEGWEDRGLSSVQVHKSGEHETGYNARTCYNPAKFEVLTTQAGLMSVSLAINLPHEGPNSVPFTPEKCPTGWANTKSEEEGIHQNTIPTTLSDTGWIIIAYQERVCVRPAAGADRGTFIYPKCAWYGSSSGGAGFDAGCTPSICPSGWTDYGLSNLYVSQILAATTGYVRRVCYNPAKFEISSTQNSFEATATAGEILPPAGAPGPGLCPSEGGSDGSGITLITIPTSISIPEGHTYEEGHFTISGYQERICVK